MWLLFILLKYYVLITSVILSQHAIIKSSVRPKNVIVSSRYVLQQHALLCVLTSVNLRLTNKYIKRKLIARVVIHSHGGWNRGSLGSRVVCCRLGDSSCLGGGSFLRLGSCCCCSNGCCCCCHGRLGGCYFRNSQIQTVLGGAGIAVSSLPV